MTKENTIIGKDLWDKLSAIHKLLLDDRITNKPILTLSEAAVYMDVSESYLYKLTSTQAIPFSKPTGKRVFFKRIDLDKWMMETRSADSSFVA